MTPASQKVLLEETINLELNMAKLYSFYHSLFNHHKDFWWRLMNEENNHAALLKSGRDFLALHILPEELLTDNILELKKINQDVSEKIKAFTQKSPTFKEACEFAISLEKLAFEAHYEHIMTHATDEKIIKIFQRLNNSDKNHAERIQTLLQADQSRT